MQAQRFAARWSLSVWIVTLAVIAFVGFAMGGMLWTATRDAHTREAWLLGVSALALPTILCITVFFAPLGYSILTRGVVIHRMGRNVAIGFEQIAEIRRIEPKEIGLAIRVFGSGGFFGWFGRFHGRRLGWFTAYCSSGRDLILIARTDGAKIVISPHPADAFLESAERAKRDLA